MAKAALDCSARGALAYRFAECGREKMRRSREGRNPAQFIFKEHTKHDFEWVLVVKMPFPLTNREFLGRGLGFKEPTGDFVVVSAALPDSANVDYGANLKVVRGRNTGVWRLKPMNDGTQCEGTSSLLVTQVPLRQSTNSSPPSLAAQSPLCSTWTLAETCRSGS